ncbi:MAG: 16S rRNA (cytosine(1402)-N(4))-methyltransferase RsmH [Caldilineales bacterium]
MTATQHVSVMTHEVIELLGPRAGGRYIDATAGGGGHSEALLQAIAASANAVFPSLLSLDADPKAVERVRARLERYGDQALVVHSNFRNLQAVAVAQQFTQVDGIVFDLGFSSDQLQDTARGFSMAASGSLDMRFDTGQELTAASLINELSEKELADLIYEYGEERKSRRIASAIVRNRPIVTAQELAEVIAGSIGRREKIHPATRTFQALRIAVNRELDSLREALPQAVSLLRPGGRLVVISFHSLEDRIVKQFFQTEARDCICPPETLICQCGHKASVRILTRRPLQPGADEVAANSRSRSAKLRAVEKLGALQ